VTIEGAGHACNMEQPWVFDRAMLDFLAARGLIAPIVGVSEAG